MKARLCGVVAAVCLLGGPAAAEDPAAQTAPSATGACAGQTLSTFTIRSARVNDPFWILRWRKLDESTLEAVNALAGKPFTFDAVNAVAKKVEENGWLPTGDATRFNVSYSDTAVENCAEGKLDVVFFVFSAGVSSGLSSTIEWRRKQTQDAAAASGVADPAKPQFTGDAGFEPGRRFYAGGGARATFAHAGPFQSVEVHGTGSSSSRELLAGLGGVYNSKNGWLERADWRLDFYNNRMPAGVGNEIGQNRLAGRFAVSTRPLGGVVARAGAALEGGALQSAFAATDLAAGTVSNTHYTSARFYGGATGNWRNQSFAASFGLALGSTGDSFHGDWRKAVGDVSHQLWLPVGNYRFFELEQRFTAGGIQNLNSVPVAERFFGGSHERPFLPGSDWSIRANPVIRSIPANRLFATAAGVGGDGFWSYNSTTALTAWGVPIVPAQLRDDPQFQKLLNGAIVSQSSILQVYYRTKDPHFGLIRNRMPAVLAKLAEIASAKDAAEAAAPASLKPDFSSCASALSMSKMAAAHVKGDKAVGAMGWVPELLPGGLGPLAATVAACGTSLAPKLTAASVSATALVSTTQDLDTIAKATAADFQAIDNPAAKKKADSDVSYIQRTLDIIVRQMTITSISPVFVFDAARITPQPVGPLAGNRYGVGGGVRLTLVSTVSFTFGYAVNVHQRPGEGKGALFFNLTTRNLFQ